MGIDFESILNKIEEENAKLLRTVFVSPNANVAYVVDKYDALLDNTLYLVPNWCWKHHKYP